MSSPLASKKTNAFGRALIMFHQAHSHSHRTQLLSQLFAKVLSKVFDKNEEISCLDVGCGDMTLAELVEEALPSSSWTCMDVYKLPEDLKGIDRWSKYRQFDGKEFPFEDNEFDVVLFSDVLHHAQNKTHVLLAEAARISRVVLVKDHFEYSFWSRFCLWAMDFVGNWGYGVSLPRRYFTNEAFHQIVSEAGLQTRDLSTGIDLYQHIPVFRKILRKEWQFLAILEPTMEHKSKGETL